MAKSKWEKFRLWCYQYAGVPWGLIPAVAHALYRLWDGPIRWYEGLPPRNYWHYHHKDCGRAYRGCHPTACPKDQYEKTGKWRVAPGE
jgi:hypothetical protein